MVLEIANFDGMGSSRQGDEAGADTRAVRTVIVDDTLSGNNHQRAIIRAGGDAIEPGFGHSDEAVEPDGKVILTPFNRLHIEVVADPACQRLAQRGEIRHGQKITFPI